MREEINSETQDHPLKMSENKSVAGRLLHFSLVTINMPLQHMFPYDLHVIFSPVYKDIPFYWPRSLKEEEEEDHLNQRPTVSVNETLQ